MSADPFDELEGRVESLLEALVELKKENAFLKEENQRLKEERGGFKSRIDSILKRLEGI